VWYSHACLCSGLTATFSAKAGAPVPQKPSVAAALRTMSGANAPNPVFVESCFIQRVTRTIYQRGDVTGASGGVQITMLDVTANTLIFTTMLCVISHHIGVNHSNFWPVEGAKRDVTSAPLVVVTTKHGIWEIGQKTLGLDRFGTTGAL